MEIFPKSKYYFRSSIRGLLIIQALVIVVVFANMFAKLMSKWLEDGYKTTVN